MLMMVALCIVISVATTLVIVGIIDAPKGNNPTESCEQGDSDKSEQSGGQINDNLPRE